MKMLGDFFGGSKTAVLEVYGKLPFYQDYIAVLSTPEAISWKSWLLGFAGREGVILPTGRWRFLFRQSRKSPVIAGIIEHSSDGIRQFPFSLFVSLAGIRTGLLAGAAAMAWPMLARKREGLDGVSSIEECYRALRGHQLRIESAKEASVPELVAALADAGAGSHPLFLVCTKIAGRVQPLALQGSASSFLHQWQEMAARV